MASKDSGNSALQEKPVMHMNPRIEKDRAMITEARAKGTGAVLWSYLKLSGPGWLQSGITLGGGSLSSSLYLGVLVCFCFMWLQPLAMILGIQLISIGLLGEMLRYFTFRPTEEYAIRRVLGETGVTDD